MENIEEAPTLLEEIIDLIIRKNAQYVHSILVPYVRSQYIARFTPLLCENYWIDYREYFHHNYESPLCDEDILEAHLAYNINDYLNDVIYAKTDHSF